MKKVLLNTLAITALFGLMSNACDDLVEDLEVDVPVEIVKTINFDEPAGSDEINDRIQIDPSSELAKYDISSVDIEEISYEATFDASTATDAVLSLTFIATHDLSNRYEIAVLDNIIADQEGVLESAESAIAYLEEAINLKQIIYIVYNGNKEGGAVKGSVTLKIKATAKGKLK